MCVLCIQQEAMEYGPTAIEEVEEHVEVRKVSSFLTDDQLSSLNSFMSLLEIM